MKCSNASREVFYEALCDLERRELLRNAVSRVYVLIHGLGESARANVFHGLCVLGDRLPELRGYGEDDWLKLGALGVVTGLLREANHDFRVRLIEGVLQSKAGLDFPVGFIAQLNRKTDYGTVDLEVDAASAQWLEAVALKRIGEAAVDGTLWESDWRGWHLSFWSRHVGDQPVRDWVISQITTPTRVVHLIKAYVSVSTSGERYFPRLQATDLERFVELSALDKLMPQTLPASPRERDALIMFHKALRLKAEGQPSNEVTRNDRDP